MLFMVLLTSCGEYQQLLKSRDPEEKYQAALRYFNEKQYVKAQTLLDDVSSYYKGTERSEDILAYLARSYMGQTSPQPTTIKRIFAITQRVSTQPKRIFR